MAISDYTDNISAIEKDEKNQKADLKLSEEVSKAYITPINTFHTDFEARRGNMNGLESMGPVGTLKSANQTAQNLARAVTGYGGVQATTEQHVAYLKKLADAVKSAHDLLIKNG